MSNSSTSSFCGIGGVLDDIFDEDKMREYLEKHPEVIKKSLDYNTLDEAMDEWTEILYEIIDHTDVSFRCSECDSPGFVLITQGKETSEMKFIDD